jgi:DNA repair exonuclease SbcCD ATPase subunit
MLEVNKKVASLAKQLSTETTRADGASGKLAECQQQLSAALRDLSDCRVQLVDESRRRREVEERCKALASEVQTGSQRLEDALSALQSEVKPSYLSLRVYDSDTAGCRNIKQLAKYCTIEIKLDTAIFFRLARKRSGSARSMRTRRRERHCVGYRSTFPFLVPK